MSRLAAGKKQKSVEHCLRRHPARCGRLERLAADWSPASAGATHPIGPQRQGWGSRIRLMQAAVTGAPVRVPPVEPSANSVEREYGTQA